MALGVPVQPATGSDLYAQQACRIGKVVQDPIRAPQPVVCGLDGKVLLLDSKPGIPGTPPFDAILTQSEDFGFGGQALALYDLTGEGYDEILYAPYWCQVDKNGNPASSKLFVLQHTGPGFNKLASVPLGDTSASYLKKFPGYGACGIAVANLDTTTNDPEILVSTLNGEIVVFRSTWSGGTLTLTPIHYRVVEGGIGAFNAIVIADLTGPSGMPDNKLEVYLAGSSGIRRFDL